jgi:hypothetical protein
MMGQTCNDIPGSRLTIALCYVPCFASSCSCVVGSISTTANCLRRRNPHQAVKNKDRNYTRSSLREFIPDADERSNYYLDRLDRRNAVGTTAVAREPRTSNKSRLCLKYYKPIPARLEYGSTTKVDVGYNVQMAVDANNMLIVVEIGRLEDGCLAV